MCCCFATSRPEVYRARETKLDGDVALTGPTSQAVNGELLLPRSPRRVLVNAMHDVLAR